jgi:hypothetical protein
MDKSVFTILVPLKSCWCVQLLTFKTWFKEKWMVPLVQLSTNSAFCCWSYKICTQLWNNLATVERQLRFQYHLLPQCTDIYLSSVNKPHQYQPRILLSSSNFNFLCLFSSFKLKNCWDNKRPMLMSASHCLKRVHWNHRQTVARGNVLSYIFSPVLCWMDLAMQFKNSILTII